MCNNLEKFGFTDIHGHLLFIQLFELRIFHVQMQQIEKTRGQFIDIFYSILRKSVQLFIKENHLPYRFIRYL